MWAGFSCVLLFLVSAGLSCIYSQLEWPGWGGDEGHWATSLSPSRLVHMMAVRDSKSQTKAAFKSPLTSCLLSSHGQSKSRGQAQCHLRRKLLKAWYREAWKNQGLFMQPPFCVLDPGGRSGDGNGEKWSQRDQVIDWGREWGQGRNNR